MENVDKHAHTKLFHLYAHKSCFTRLTLVNCWHTIHVRQRRGTGRRRSVDTYPWCGHRLTALSGGSRDPHEPREHYYYGYKVFLRPTRAYGHREHEASRCPVQPRLRRALLGPTMRYGHRSAQCLWVHAVRMSSGEAKLLYTTRPECAIFVANI